MKNFLLYQLKKLPYIIAFFVSALFLFQANRMSEGIYRDLFINLSASFVAIPLVLIFIDLLKDKIDKNLKKELFDYSKKNVDNDILSSINYINKLFNSPILPTNNPLFKSIITILNFNEKMIIEMVNLSEPLGFQLFKNWGETKKYT